MNAMTETAPTNATRSAAAPAAPKRAAANATSATTASENKTPSVDPLALAICLKQGTLLIAFAACMVGIGAARFSERSWVSAVFCGSLAALVSASIATILSRLFLEQVKAQHDASAAERTGAPVNAAAANK